MQKEIFEITSGDNSRPASLNTSSFELQTVTQTEMSESVEMLNRDHLVSFPRCLVSLVCPILHYLRSSAAVAERDDEIETQPENMRWSDIE